MELFTNILPILFVAIGIGVPVYFTARNSKPINIIRRIFEELKRQPKELWFHYFTKRGLEKWLECEDFNLDDIKNIQHLDYHYGKYVGKIKVKIQLPNDEIVYHFSLVKNPDIRAKSRWVISDMYKD